MRNRRTVLGAAVVSCGAIALPALGLDLARQLSGVSLPVALLSAAPLAAAFAIAIADGQSLQARLGPAVLGVAGMLTLLPVAEPSTLRGFSGLVLSLCIAVGMGAAIVVCHKRFGSMSLPHAALIATLPNAALLWIVFAYTSAGRLRYADLFTVDTAILVLAESAAGALTVWLLRVMSPLAYATRTLWVPLIAAVEGYIALRPPLSWRISAGATMLVCSSLLLAREPADVSDEVLQLR